MYNFENLSRPKTIAFDFDKTISDNPQLFLSVMEMFEKFDWRVIVVTYRKWDCFPEDLDFLVKKGYAVYFTGQVAKDKFMKSLDISVDIWVDDEPQTIVENFDPFTGEFSK